MDIHKNRTSIPSHYVWYIPVWVLQVIGTGTFSIWNGGRSLVSSFRDSAAAGGSSTYGRLSPSSQASAFDSFIFPASCVLPTAHAFVIAGEMSERPTRRRHAGSMDMLLCVSGRGTRRRIAGGHAAGDSNCLPSIVSMETGTLRPDPVCLSGLYSPASSPHA